MLDSKPTRAYHKNTFKVKRKALIGSRWLYKILVQIMKPQALQFLSFKHCSSEHNGIFSNLSNSEDHQQERNSVG